jgi:predicted PurR-regulated permease PerM
MSNNILTYFFIGVVFTFLIEVLVSKLEEKNFPNFNNQIIWNNTQRLLCVILWPFGIVFFLVSFFRSWLN